MIHSERSSTYMYVSQTLSRSSLRAWWLFQWHPQSYDGMKLLVAIHLWDGNRRQELLLLMHNYIHDSKVHNWFKYNWFKLNNKLCCFNDIFLVASASDSWYRPTMHATTPPLILLIAMHHLLSAILFEHASPLLYQNSIHTDNTSFAICDYSLGIK